MLSLLPRTLEMEAIRDIDNHLVCYADYARGFIEHSYQKEMISICLPTGGEVMFKKGSCYTIIRRLDTGQFYVYSHHFPGMGSSRHWWLWTATIRKPDGLPNRTLTFIRRAARRPGIAFQNENASWPLFFSKSSCREHNFPKLLSFFFPFARQSAAGTWRALSRYEKEKQE